MKRPRNLGAAHMDLCCDARCNEPHIYINAMRIGGSVVQVSPSYARKMGQRLIEMADYIDSQKKKGE